MNTVFKRLLFIVAFVLLSVGPFARTCPEIPRTTPAIITQNAKTTNTYLLFFIFLTPFIVLHSYHQMSILLNEIFEKFHLIL